MESLKDLLNPAILWSLIGLALLIGEFVLPGVILVFFGAGALVVAILCAVMALSLNAQLLVFLIASVLMLVALRRWLKGVFRGHTTNRQNGAQNADAFLGENAVVTQAIRPGQPGKVEFHGSAWKAESKQELATGDRVVITGHSSLTLSVRRKS